MLYEVITRRSGLLPRWSHDGNEIFFLDGPTLMAAALQIGTGFAVSTVTPLFDISGQSYDVFPGDSLFAAMMPLADGPLRKRELNIIHNIDVLLSRLEGSGR